VTWQPATVETESS